MTRTLPLALLPAITSAAKIAPKLAKTLKVAAITWLLSACATLPTGARPVPTSTTDAALHAWTTAGYPAGRCGATMKRLRVVVRDDVRQLCRGDVRGCYTSRLSGFGGLGGSYPIVVMRADVAGPALLAHEVVHAMLICSDVDHAGDPWHRWGAFWGRDGVEGAIWRAVR